MKRTMLAAAVAMQVFAIAAQAQTPALPSGRDVLVKSMHVTGVDTALAKHTSVTMTGSLGIPAAGITAPITIVKSAAGEFHASIEIEGMGTVEQGYADGTAWTINPQAGASIITGAAQASAKRQALWMDSPDNYTKLENQGIEKFQGKDAYKIAMETKDGAKLTRYFDTTTGLNIGTISTQDAGQGEVTVTAYLSDYKNFGGVMFPTKQVQMIGDTEQDITYDKIEFDNVAKTAFALPPAIVALKK